MSDAQYAATVDELLIRLRTAIDENRFNVLVKRPKNKSTIDDLQYTYEDVVNEFKTLGKHQCDAGPEPDNKRDRGMFWMFHKTIQGKYIYMKVMESNFGNFYVGFSFHYPKEV